jgi:SAM-dependent methyltransferase
MMDINSLLFLVQARRAGVPMERVLTIGRHELNVYPRTLCKVLSKAGFPTDLFAPGRPVNRFAEPVFMALGAKKVLSMDASDFEGADIVHDLNTPIDDSLKQSFDVVYDDGTLEHVFNVPVALKNCMEMLKPGGTFICQTAANNWFGHGFYQFSPELFYNVFSRDNGFAIEEMLVHVVGPYGKWYRVANPIEIGARVELFNSFPLLMLVMARRLEVVPLFRVMPQQSDYVTRWNQPTNLPAQRADRLLVSLAAVFPRVARFAHALQMGWSFWTRQSLRNRRSFTPVRKPF